MNLGWGIVHMMVGHKRITRAAWPKDCWLEAEKPEANSKMTLPYLFITTGRDRVPWTPSQVDLLAEDYEFA
jgi:uncharacterized protein DUF2829